MIFHCKAIVLAHLLCVQEAQTQLVSIRGEAEGGGGEMRGNNMDYNDNNNSSKSGVLFKIYANVNILTRKIYMFFKPC